MDIGINKDEAQLIYDSLIYTLKMGMGQYVDFLLSKSRNFSTIDSIEVCYTDRGLKIRKENFNEQNRKELAGESYQ